ncbi:MAG: ATP-dependent DNA helicase UvrD2 [Euzebyales bacterium]|nr:ATP-dependent DNA helicase UvrD2 [Euzebyales bacterium]
MTSAPTSTPAATWARGLLDGLNPAQREAAEAVEGPVCILAGAGTGKTRTITHRIANQVAAGVARPDEILAVTFTDRAAGELRQRLAAFGMPGRIRAATFHSAAWAQLRHFWPRVSDRRLPEVLASKLRLLIPMARRLRVQASDLAAEIEWAKARRLDPEGYAREAAGRDAPLAPRDMAEVYARYEDAKRDADVIDFDDMLALATDAISGVEAVAEEFRGRYRFFTVDEFQDVNPAQSALLAAWLGDSEQLCVVGDDDQTIYRFTGATPDYLTGFHRRFRGARRVTLTQNYRSTPEILDLANRVLWTKPASLRKRLAPTRPAGPAPRFEACDDERDERSAVVAEIRALLADGVTPGEVAICYRINAQSADWEEALREGGIAYVVRGGGGFFARPEIRQALGALRRSSGSADLDGGEPGGSGRSATPDPSVPAGTVAARAPRPHRQAERALREQLSYHPKRPPAGAAARERWENLGALLSLVERLGGEQPSWTLADVTTELLTRAAAGHDTPDEAGAVTLLTLHRAKGLEFDAVFIVGCEEGLLPITYATDDVEVEDERRLFYVGVTRARRHLWLSWAKTRVGRSGRTARRRPSRFLYGLGEGAPSKSGAGTTLALPKVAAPDLTAEQQEVAERLRAWRRERAKADGSPAFVVFNDRTLHALAQSRPRSPEELLGVHGFGPAKLVKYGDDVLSLLRGPG